MTSTDPRLRPRVVVVGNAGIDTNVFLPGSQVDWSRESNFTSNVDYVGQAGGYASRGYAQLGYPTAYLGALGDDVAGQWVRRDLSADSIDLSGVFLDPAGTARSVNIMGVDGTRKNFYDGRGHAELTVPEGLAARVFAGAELIHLNIPHWARQVIPAAEALGIPMACDLQDVADPFDPYRSDFVRAAVWLFCSGVNHPKLDTLVEPLLTQNPAATIIVGLGPAGCAVADAVGVRRYPVPDSDLPLIDTNGAGDALAVGFLSARVLDGLPESAAVERGQRAARWTCAQRASSATLLPRTQR